MAAVWGLGNAITGLIGISPTMALRRLLILTDVKLGLFLSTLVAVARHPTHVPSQRTWVGAISTLLLADFAY